MLREPSDIKECEYCEETIEKAAQPQYNQNSSDLYQRYNVTGRATSVMRPAIFFDRDNTLTIDKGYCHKIEDFAWMPEVEAALRLCHQAAIPIFIVTNQGGIARQIFSYDDMTAFHHHLCDKAAAAGSHITDIAYCPHHPKARDPAARLCDCRKPAPTMLHQLATKWDISLAHSVMIGDRPSDILAGQYAGCHSYLYEPHSPMMRFLAPILAAHFGVTPS